MMLLLGFLTVMLTLRLYCKVLLLVVRLNCVRVASVMWNLTLEGEITIQKIMKESMKMNMRV